MLLYAFLLVLPALVLGQNTLRPFDLTAAEYFDAIDINNDNRIGPGEKHRYFDRYDTNDNGQVSRHEFTTAIDADSSHFKGFERELFDYYDINVDNHLTESDFLYVFNINDFNNDGFISRDEEFIPYWIKVFEALEDPGLAG